MIKGGKFMEITNQTPTLECVTSDEECTVMCHTDCGPFNDDDE